MTERAPGFDPDVVSTALEAAETAESIYMDGGDGDSLERLFVAADALLDLEVIERTLDTHMPLEMPNGRYFCTVCNEDLTDEAWPTHQALALRSRLLWGIGD